MSERSGDGHELEELFERYRSGGDLAALGAVFDRTAPELLALGAHLARDPVEAEDLVQNTFVAAIEGARSFEPGRRLEPWLAGILARQALRLFRERGRRPDPRRLAAPQAGDPTRGAEERELAFELRRALSELPEPYRGVLEQHLLQGARPLDIARARRRAPGTVRMQILRGLERLRRALPAGLFSVLPPSRAPRGLDALRAEVLARGELALGAGSAVVASSLVGALLMSKLLVSLIAAAVLGLVGFWTLKARPDELASPLVEADPGGAPVELAREEGASTPAARRSLADSVDVQPGDRLRDERAEPAAPTAAPGIWLVGSLLGLGDERPERTSIVVTDFQRDSVSGAGAPDGTYAVELTGVLESAAGVRHVYVTATHPAQRRCSVEYVLPESEQGARPQERTELRLDLDLSPRTVLFGRVVVCAGVAPRSVSVGICRPVPGPAGAGFEGIAEDVRCAEDGSFLLYPEESGEYLLVAHAWGVPPASRLVRAAQGEATDAGTLHLARGGVAIEGAVALPLEIPLDPFQVRASRTPEERAGGEDAGWEGLGFRGAALEVVEQVGELQSDGSFRVEGLVPGSYDLWLEAGDSDHLVVPFPATTARAPGTGVAFGEHYGRVRVRVTGPDAAAERVSVGYQLDGSSSCRGAELGVPVGLIADRRAPLSLLVQAPGWSAQERELPADARSVDEELEIPLGSDGDHARLLVEWTPAAEEPARITARLRSGSQELDAGAAAAAGTCLFQDLAPGRYEVTLEPRHEGSWAPLASTLYAEPFEIDLVAGQTARSRVVWRPGGRARFVPDASRPAAAGLRTARVLDAWGHPVDVRFLTRESTGGVTSISVYPGIVPVHQTSELEPNLPPGSYELLLEQDGATTRLPFLIRAGEIAEVPLPAE